MSTRGITWGRRGAIAWQGTWEGTGPFEIWREGRLIESTDGTSYFVEDEAWEDFPPPIEVVDTDTADVASGGLHPPFAVLRWWGQPGVFDYYLIKRWNGSAFAQAAVKGEHERGYHRWEGEAVEKPTAELYQVIGVDTDGTESDPLPFSFYVKGIPGRPTQSLSYDAGTGEVTAVVSL